MKKREQGEKHNISHLLYRFERVRNTEWREMV